MPTPSDITIPVAHEESHAHTNFTSCPPDERDFFASIEPHTDIGDDTLVTRHHNDDEITQHDETTQRDGPAFDDGGTSESLHELNLGRLAKEEQSDEGHSISDTASTAATPESSDYDGVPLVEIKPQVERPQYLDHLSSTGAHKNSTTSLLRPGSKFHGTQQSDRQVYDVQVEIKDVNLEESFLCGYLRIQGLTDDHPTLTTFFEGEIIGPKHLFKTTHASWGSTEKVDLQHWARFPAWRPLAKSARSPNFTLKNFQQREHLFMRWKEYFLVPDHRVKTITGASFEGFYYICFNQCDGRVSGIYFHAKSEKYQRLELQHVEDRGCMSAVQFR